MNNKDTTDDDDDEFFGGETIRAVAGNPMIARGAFGEISLAVQYCTTGSVDPNDQQQQQQQQQQQSQQQPTCLLKLVAVKTLIRTPPPPPPPHAISSAIITIDDDDPVANELKALRVLNPHPNIVQLLAVYASRQGIMTGHAICAAFAYCPVDLDLALSWRRRTLRPLLSMPVIQTIARDLFAALEHCHAHGILHRDVKPHNCLVSAATSSLQLCDFGLALLHMDAADGELSQKTRQNQQHQDTRLCTLHYRPPEVLLGARAVHAAVDVYSAGLTLVEVLSGDGIVPLFPGTNDLSQLTCIFKALGTPTRESWPSVHELPDWGKLTFATQSPMLWTDLVPRAAEYSGVGRDGDGGGNLVDFLQGCIRLDPAQRRSAADCLKHAWLAPSLAAAASDSRVSDATTRATIVTELVPPELREPLLLAPPPPPPTSDSHGSCDDDGENWTVVKRQVLRRATTRRSFLKSLEPWKDLA
jgi:serine/threonine protein kinase